MRTGGAKKQPAKSDQMLWMRFTLDTVGKVEWPRDSQGRALYPDGFEKLAEKLKRPLHPPVVAHLQLVSDLHYQWHALRMPRQAKVLLRRIFDLSHPR